MIETIQLAISLLTLLLLAFGAYHGVSVYKKQMSAQLFLAFTQRYADVIAGFTDQSGQIVDISDTPPPECEQIRAATIRLLNLISEEYYLYSRGFLDPMIWAIWEREICETLRGELVRREWKTIRRNYNSFPDFQKFVESQIGSRITHGNSMKR